MRTVLLRTTAFAIATLCSAAVWGQAPAEKSVVLAFTHAETPQQLQEIANLFGAIVNGGHLYMDMAQGTLSVRGTAEQVELAEWLAKQIDKPADTQPSRQVAPVAPEYVAGEDDVVRMLHVTSAKSVQEFQEFWTIVRGATEMRLVFGLNSQNRFAVRGTHEQVRLAEWLVNELDKTPPPANTVANPANQEVAAGANPPAPEYVISGNPEKSQPPSNLVRVFYLTQTPTEKEFQEVVTMVRGITDCRRISSIDARKALVVRGTAWETALAEFLYNEVQAAKQPSPDAPPAAEHEYRIIPVPPYPALDLVRVFHIAGMGTVQEFQAFATTVRNTALIRQVFTYNEPRLLVVRGSASQIAQARQIVDGRRKPSAQ
jgi:hypothetical protein